jgi:hypothetical protein
MTHQEARFRLATVLLRAGGPLTLRELASAAEVTGVFAREAADGLVDAGDVLLVEERGVEPRYRWAAELDAGSKQSPPTPPALASMVVRHFVEYVLHGYSPPAQARVLAVFQCCVGRPFYRTQSHAFMRHAVQAATGEDPYHQATTCPVHVVVLGSWIGPVPYELQNVYPATVSAGGVKQMSEAAYARAKPVLVERMAEYLRVHGSRYESVVTFTDGRYADVMREAARVSRRTVTVLPEASGARVERYQGGRPRTYWQRYWVQLALELGRLAGSRGYAATLRRLREMGVEATSRVDTVSIAGVDR